MRQSLLWSRSTRQKFLYRGADFDDGGAPFNFQVLDQCAVDDTFKFGPAAGIHTSKGPGLLSQPPVIFSEFLSNCRFIP